MLRWAPEMRGLAGEGNGMEMTESMLGEGEMEEEVLGMGMLADLDGRVVMTELEEG